MASGMLISKCDGVVDDEKRFLKKLARRHPEKKTPAGILLTEILHGKSQKDRERAASIYGFRRYRGGLKQLEKLIEETVVKIPIPPKGEWLVTDERNFISYLLWAVARMDTPQSHAIFIRLLKSRNHFVRADALEQMAFEDKQHDPKRILPFIDKKYHAAEIMSALYAMMYRPYLKSHAAAMRRRVAPMLKHAYPNVRSIAIETLAFVPGSRDLILTCKRDRYAHVRRAVKQSVAQIRFVEQARKK